MVTSVVRRVRRGRHGGDRRSFGAAASARRSRSPRSPGRVAFVTKDVLSVRAATTRQRLIFAAVRDFDNETAKSVILKGISPAIS